MTWAQKVVQNLCVISAHIRLELQQLQDDNLEILHNASYDSFHKGKIKKQYKMENEMAIIARSHISQPSV